MWRGEGGGVAMMDGGKEGPRVDGKGRMVHKASNQLLALLPGGRVEMRSFREADREVLLV